MNVATMASRDRWPYKIRMKSLWLASAGAVVAIDDGSSVSPPVSQDEESGGPLVLDGPFIETKELAFARLRRGSHKRVPRRDDT